MCIRDRSYAKGAKLEAACVVTCVGSLSKVSLRLANADGGKRGSNETVSLEERFEIVSLAGTVSRHGCHLHMSLSDYQGNVVGGHVLDGCVVFTHGGDGAGRVRRARLHA